MELKTLANEYRGLCFDMIAQANSGHLGLPLGCAECVAVLFGKFLRYLPKNPRWLNRDRFVLSAGHGSPLLYAALYLSGYDISLEDLKALRQMGSKATGHPEFGITPGVETTTGPLGQGIGNAVGIALSQKKCAAWFNTPDAPIFDACTVCLCGEGCLQEGVGQESIALAGLWQLDNLILIYDCNKVTLDRPSACSQNDDIQQRFESIGWDVFEVDGHDCAAIEAQLNHCRSLQGKPKLIILNTVIGYGLKVAGTSKAHAAEGLKDGVQAKVAWGLDPEQSFFVSEETRRFFEKREGQLQKAYNEWASRFETWTAAEPDKARLLGSKPRLKVTDFAILPLLRRSIEIRACMGALLNAYAQQAPLFLSGSADVFASTKTYLMQGGDFAPDNLKGRNLFFGVREHAMGAIMNGIAYDGIFNVCGSAFLVFSDYLKPALRVAAMAHLPVWYVFTHDSVSVGEDGPTHQPVEQLCGIRSMPNVRVFRPADVDECAACLQQALDVPEGPSVWVAAKQELPYLSTVPSQNKLEGAYKGGYIILKETDTLRCILIATGSEVDLAIKTAQQLGTDIRVVSMPCCEVFLQQPEAYQERILPSDCTCRVAIEAGSSLPWYRLVGLKGKIIGVDQFGKSAPAGALRQLLGLTPEACTQTIQQYLSAHQGVIK